MAVPRKKVSIAKKHQRTSTWRTNKIKKTLKKLVLVACPNCGSLKRKHHVCPSCGYYKDKQVLIIKERTSQDVIEA
jgi:large subunit ribosomal protein L32